VLVSFTELPERKKKEKGLTLLKGSGAIVFRAAKDEATTTNPSPEAARFE